MLSRRLLLRSKPGLSAPKILPLELRYKSNVNWDAMEIIRPTNFEVFPPHFEQRLGEWIKLLKDESRAQLDNGKHWALTLPLVRSTREPIIGHRLIFSLDQLTRREKQILDEIRARDLVRLWPQQMSTLSAVEDGEFPEKINGDEPPEKTMNGSNYIQGAIISKDNSQLVIRLGRDKFEHLSHLIKPNTNHWCIQPDSMNPYEKMIDLLQNPQILQKYPGYKLMLYAYKVKTDEKMKRKAKDKRRSSKKINELNQSQLDAVAAAINPNRPIVAIHGPPGTGKTKVIAEIVFQVTRKKKRVLVCAPSHKAVDSVMSACKNRGLQDFVRFGDAEDNALRKYELNMAAQAHDQYKRVKDAISRSEQIESSLDFTENKQRQRRIFAIWKENEQREDQMKRDTLEDKTVIFCTCASGQALRFLEKGWFQPDLVVLDEAAQIIECASWIMLLHAPRCVIVGDHKQLPPLMHSNRENGSLYSGFSFLEYLQNTFSKKDFFCFLSIQYRSNELIQRWSNKMFYEDKLASHASAKNSNLKNLTYKKFNNKLITDGTTRSINSQQRSKNAEPLLIEEPLVLVDTEKGVSDSDWAEVYERYKLWRPLNFQEAKRANSKSYFNIGEAFCAFLHLRALHLIGGLDPRQIGCITPYFAQTERIRNFLAMDGDITANDENGRTTPEFEVSSVDAFQGQEREAIVMSFVRNNLFGEIGFLREHRRTNVAITRAKRQFLLIASSKMLQKDIILRELYNIIKADGLIVGPDALLPCALSLSKRTREQYQLCDGVETVNNRTIDSV